MTAFSFKPSILQQPTRVTSTSATLIDNIFTNDLNTSTVGGNLTTSLSDHFPQFTFFEGFEQEPIPKSHKRGRSFKNFVNHEFENELRNIAWQEIFQNKSGNESFEIFYRKIEQLLNEMAPVKTLTRKEVNSYANPWLTSGILKSIKNRDKLHHDFLKAKDNTKKQQLFNKYKIKRNLIVNLIRISKKMYYNRLFSENIKDMKET